MAAQVEEVLHRRHAERVVDPEHGLFIGAAASQEPVELDGAGVALAERLLERDPASRRAGPPPRALPTVVANRAGRQGKVRRDRTVAGGAQRRGDGVPRRSGQLVRSAGTGPARRAVPPARRRRARPVARGRGGGTPRHPRAPERCRPRRSRAGAGPPRAAPPARGAGTGPRDRPMLRGSRGSRSSAGELAGGQAADPGTARNSAPASGSSPGSSPSREVVMNSSSGRRRRTCRRSPSWPARSITASSVAVWRVTAHRPAVGERHPDSALRVDGQSVGSVPRVPRRTRRPVRPALRS